jgi:hypothetical protein
VELSESGYFDHILDYNETTNFITSGGFKKVPDRWHIEESDDEGERPPIEDIPLTETFYASQDWISDDNFRDYTEGVKAGDVFPPIIAIHIPEHGYVVWNGHHRFSAHKAAGAESIRAYVYRPTQEEGDDDEGY